MTSFEILFLKFYGTKFQHVYAQWSRLKDASYAVGAQVLELLCHRDKVADSLEKGTEHEDEYMISEKELLQGTTNGSKVGLMLRPRLDWDLRMQPPSHVITSLLDDLC